MAVLKDLIVHGPSRFVGITEFTNLKADKIKANEGIFKKLIATTADFDSMTANNATVVGLLDVKGELHTNSWTNSNIATIEGSFYITPTISCASGTFNYDGTNITLTAGSGLSFAISSLYINSGDNAGTTIAWSAYSEVLITGQVAVGNEKVPLGTIKGKITSTAPTTSKIIINSLTDGKGTASNVLASIGTGSKTFYDIKISLLKRGNGSNVANALPIGIYMTAMGQNGTTFLDIYGGHNAASTAVAGGLAKPVLRIGNLSGLPAVGGKTPGGYGIYTSNGYFTGTIVSTSGTIGNWSITSSSIQTGAFNTAGKMYFGNSGISLGNTFKVTSAGELTATSGTIGGITIGGTYLTTAAARKTYDATTAGLTITSTGIGAGNGTANTFKVVAATGALTASNATLTGGAIAGWTFNTTSLYKTNATPGYSTTTMVISTGTKSTYNIGEGGTDEKTWMLSAGRGFGVTTAGTLYATGAHISGAINATSGSFKNIQIKNSNNAVVANIDSETKQLTFYYNSSGTTVQKAATFGSNGIVLYKNGSKRAEITGTGLNVYSDGTTLVASFGTTAQIGKDKESHIELDYHSMQLIDKEGDTYFWVSDLRNNAGVAVLTDVLWGDGVSNTFELHIPALEEDIISVKINGTKVTNWGLIKAYSINIQFSTVPAAGSKITVTSNITDQAAKAFTFGSRHANSTTGLFSFSAGIDNYAEGPYATTFGDSNQSSGRSSFAQGESSKAKGNGSHAEGHVTEAVGNGSHSEGANTKANGIYSHASGLATTANGAGQTVIGRNNIPDKNSLFIIGNGDVSINSVGGLVVDESNASNAFRITTEWSGQHMRDIGKIFINEEPLADFVIEQGNGYRKWNSGIAECWVHTAQNVALNNAYGSLYQGTWTWKFPITFNASPAVTCSHFRWGTGGSWGTIGGVSTTAATLRGFDTYSRAAGTCDIAAYAIGRWK